MFPDHGITPKNSAAAVEIDSKTYLRVMRMMVALWAVCLPLVAVQAQTSETESSAAIDSLSATPKTALTAEDSARIERTEVQVRLSQEVSALSQRELGSGTFAWTHRALMTIERAGQTQAQYFWSNPKNDATPKLWSNQISNANVVFYLDPATGRAATLNLNQLSGSFIPARIAEQAGFTGNGSNFLSKKSNDWQIGERNDSTQTWSVERANETIHLVLSNDKDTGRARAMLDWLKLQPMEGISLPSIAEKFPVLSVRVIDAAGVVAYHVVCSNWLVLESPLEIDAAALTISDPERDLRTIAREWAAKQEQEKKSDTKE